MKLVIYHTNDIHSDFNFVKNVHLFMKENKNRDDFYFDSGDLCDMKDVIIQADRGKSAVELFKSTKVDAMTIGNNEIDLENKDLSKLVKNKLPIISTNLGDNDGNDIKNLKKSIILNKKGVRFLILGLAPFYSFKLIPNFQNIFFKMGNIMSKEPISELKKEIELNNGKYDYIILLSHCGYQVDQYILEHVKVDLCLGGHSHDIVSEGFYSQSGKGERLGKITIEIVDGKLNVLKNEQIELKNKKNLEFESLYAKTRNRAIKMMSEELEIIEELDFNSFEENPLINFICDAIFELEECDLAIMHGGIANNSLKRPVSKLSLLENLPSKLNPTYYTISGDKIIEAVKASFDNEFIRQDGKGAGFRGKVLGTLGYSSNVKITENPFSIKINDKNIDPNKIYKIGTDDYLQRGTGYRSLKVPNEEAKFHKWFIRDLIENNLTNKSLFEKSKIKRIIK